jgi:predicted NAD/FAD-dependent oxidoreductase
VSSRALAAGASAPGRLTVGERATCFLPALADAAATEAEVRRQVGEVYGVDTTRWQLVHRHDIRHALPAQPPPLRTTSPARVSPSVYVCGDHRDTASIQGALVSGHRVASAVLALASA